MGSAHEKVPKPNMTPMIDVVFQLLIFFLVSMKFKTLDMQVEAFLPKDRGPYPVGPPPPPEVKIVARLVKGDADTRGARVKVLNRLIGNADDPATWSRLTTLARQVRERHEGVGGHRDDVKGEVDASPQVHTGEVVRAMDAFIEAGLEKVLFRGTPPVGSVQDRLRVR